MFDTLSIHKAVSPTVFLELLISLSPISLTPPEADCQSRIIHHCSFYTTDRTPTTENIYGFGHEAEFVEVRHG